MFGRLLSTGGCRSWVGLPYPDSSPQGDGGSWERRHLGARAQPPWSLVGSVHLRGDWEAS